MFDSKENRCLENRYGQKSAAHHGTYRAKKIFITIPRLVTGLADDGSGVEE
jgi:hypothetical protein